jgi:hypothetical protein
MPDSHTNEGSDVTEKPEHYVVNLNEVELDAQADRPKQPCSVCGSTDHHSPFLCPQVPEARKRAWRRKGGLYKNLSGRKLDGKLLFTRAGRKRILAEALSETSTLPKSTAKASVLVSIVRAFRDEFGPEEDARLAEVIEQATAIVEREKQQRAKA